MKKRNILYYNLLFALVSAVILIVLFNAPEETTSRLPYDVNHKEFFPMKKRAAEKLCDSCHSATGVSPLSADHPPQYRCLLCHRRVKEKQEKRE